MWSQSLTVAPYVYFCTQQSTAGNIVKTKEYNVTFMINCP